MKGRKGGEEEEMQMQLQLQLHIKLKLIGRLGKKKEPHDESEGEIEVISYSEYTS